MLFVVRILLVAAAFLLPMQAALAGARVALVIGNGSYEGATTLANPVNDAQDIAAKLKDLGFTVVEGYDLGKRAMEEKIGEFSDKLEGSEAAVLYYAGHGIAVQKRNFIVPIDAHLDAPAKLKFESIAIDDIAELMAGQSPVSILILDACRNNPFGRGPAVSTRGASEGSGGLAAAQSYAGAYVVYSAKDGAVALDGKGRNSPFATALLKHMGTPGITVETMMGAVKTDVLALTDNFQEPDANGLLSRPFSFAPQGDTQVATRSVEPQAEASPEEAIKHLVTDLYLKSTPANAEVYVRRMFADKGNSYGFEYSSMDELVAGKMAYLNRYQNWETKLLPGTLEVTVFDEKSGSAIFNLHFRNVLKSGKVQEGNARVTLEAENTPKGWRVSRESSVLLP